MTDEPLLVHAIQHFKDGEVWKTIYMTTYGPDARDTFEDLSQNTTETLRAVAFSVSNLDFLATQCRDFAVVALREPKRGEVDAPG